MAESRPTATAPGHVAIALVHEDPPRVLLATDEHVLSRMIAVEIVCEEDPSAIDAGALEEIREALLADDWAAAVAGWIEATGVRVDVYPDEPVVATESMSADRAAFDIRLSRLLRT